MSHTPGPWTDNGDKVFAREGTAANETEVILHRRIATVYGCNTLERKANAGLIALAPDMEEWIKDTIANLEILTPKRQGQLKIIIASGKALLRRLQNG